MINRPQVDPTLNNSMAFYGDEDEDETRRSVPGPKLNFKSGRQSPPRLAFANVLFMHYIPNWRTMSWVPFYLDIIALGRTQGARA